MKKQLLLTRMLLLVALLVGSTSVWGDKITNYTNIVSGKKYYIGATTGGNDYYLSVDGSSTSASIAGTAVTSISSATPFTFSGSGTSWTIQFESGNYLSLKSTKDNGKVQVVASASTFTASNQSGKIRLTKGSFSIQKNDSGTQFGSYANTQTDIWLEEVTAVAAPIFSTEAGAVEKGTTVTLTTTTVGATIYYTMGANPADPTSSSTAYTSAITINEATTIKAVAIKGEDKSSVITAAYTIKKVEDPTFSIKSGTAVTAGTPVELETETGGATIHYTTDGSDPTSSSPTYSAPISINSNVTIKAIAVKDNWDNSDVASATYTVIAPIPGLAIDFEASSLSQYTDWEFNNVGIHTSTITAHGGQKYGSNVNNNDNATTTAYIKTKNKIEHPGFFTCYISKETGNTTSSTWYVQISEDGNDWTDVESASATSMTKGNWNEFTADLSEYSNVYVCLYYDGSNAKRAVDDIVLTESDAIKVTPAGLATYASDKALDFSGVTGIKAYRASISDKTITFNKVDKVPAEEGMLIRAMSTLDKETTFYVPQMVTHPSSIDNAMKRGEGTAVAYQPNPEIDIYNYVLSGGVPTYRAYLQSTAALAKGFVINYDDEEGEETDGIRSIENSELRIENSNYYNLAGQRVGKDYKGIVIVNGKKMLNK